MQLKIAALALASATAVFAADGDAVAEFTVAPSIISIITTAVPSSVLSELNDPTALPGWLSDLGSSLAASQTPGWLASVPPNVETYFATAIAAAAATATGTDAVASSSAVASAGTSATSTGGAPETTGALAMGLTGAVGVLGLALAL